MREESKVKARWAGYFEWLYHADPPPVDLDVRCVTIPIADPPINCDPPLFGETQAVANRFKWGETSGICGIHAELCKAGNAGFMSLYAVLCFAWNTGIIRTEWKTGLVVPLWKGTSLRAIILWKGGSPRLQQLPWGNAVLSAGQGFCSDNY